MRIFKKIDECKEDPFRFFERLVGVELYRMRVGDYRVIADIDTETRSIVITRIGHRKNIYD